MAETSCLLNNRTDKIRTEGSNPSPSENVLKIHKRLFQSRHDRLDSAYKSDQKRFSGAVW